MVDELNNLNKNSKISSSSEDEDGFLLEQDRLNCIGCGACVAVAPDFWLLADDGIASIKGGVERPDGFEELNISKAEFQENMEAAESCPVSVIHLTSKKDGKRFI